MLTTATPAPAKPLTQAQLVAKLATDACLPRTCSVADFMQELEKVNKKIIIPVQREITRYHQGKEWKAIQALHAEKDTICGWDWHKKKRGVKVRWTTDPVREREVKNELARRERYTFKDGVKVDSMYHSNLFLASVVQLLPAGELLVRVFDQRFQYGSQKQQVQRYRRHFVLPPAFVEDLASVAINRLRQGVAFEQLPELLARLPQETHWYDRASKLKALAALCAV